MKKHIRIITVQLVITLLLAAAGVAVALSGKEIYHEIAVQPQVRLLCIILWLTLLVSFIFIMINLKLVRLNRKEYLELDHAVHTDTVSGIANRLSCDIIIEKYLDKPLPKDIGCIMFEFSNIKEINDKYGHIIGNDCIRDFSAILSDASSGLCFVGRNGGNKFLAVFESCSWDKINGFLERTSSMTERHNSIAGSHSIEYRYGTAFDEDSSVKTVTDLIALADRRTHK